MSGSDGFAWRPQARVIKYDAETIARLTAQLGHEPSGPELRALEEQGLVPDDVTDWAVGNLMTTAGINRFTDLITGAAVTGLSTTRTVVGVGNSNTAEAVGQTDLQAAAGAANRWFQGSDASNPTKVGGVITCNTTFQSGDGNFVWNEWCWNIATAAPVASAVQATATTSGIMVNRKVQNLGTKAAGAVWTHQATLTGS